MKIEISENRDDEEGSQGSFDFESFGYPKNALELYEVNK